jgi:hypothetical protein
VMGAADGCSTPSTVIAWKSLSSSCTSHENVQNSPIVMPLRAEDLRADAVDVGAVPHRQRAAVDHDAHAPLQADDPLAAERRALAHPHDAGVVLAGQPEAAEPDAAARRPRGR